MTRARWATRSGATLLIGTLGLSSVALAQSAPTAVPPLSGPDHGLQRNVADTAAPRDDARLEEAAAADARPPGPQVCDGCPPYRPGTAMLQATGLNVVYGVANLLRGQASARISPASW
jgi:hypothetical protein